MAPSVDFTAWVEPDLVVTLGGVEYSSPPPSVADAKIIIALAVLSEHRLGLVEGEPDPEVLALVKTQQIPLAVLTLGQDVYDAMVAGGVSQMTIERVGYYGMQFWARGKTQADMLAALMWAPDKAAGGEPGPKARRPTKSGPPSA